MSLVKTLKNLPQFAGVYQYYDNNNTLLYIGKAKNLKKRVKSYFSIKDDIVLPSNKLSIRINKMISETTRLEYIVLNNENDALILENSLIKQLKPKYNILLRDDKTYPYIYVDLNKTFPRFEITRKVINSKNVKYFGPFTRGSKALLDSIYETNKLIQSKTCIKGNKACLYYQIDKCEAPCENKISPKKYRTILDNAILEIYHKNKILVHLKTKLQYLSDNLRFEEAIKTRNIIENIKNIQQISNMDFAKEEFFDLFCIKIKQNKGVIVRIFVRDGKVISSNHSIFKANDDNVQAVYESILISYYKNLLPNCAKNILLAHKLKNKEQIQNLISIKQNKQIKIITPKIGIKKSIIDVAFMNCDEVIKMQNNNFNIHNLIKEFLNIESEPFRYESFDNSHMMGSASVGSMVVYEDHKFIKDSYRKYHLEAKDEYAQMNEMLQRRVSSFDTNPPPDLWVIDGGKTLLMLAKSILKTAGVNIEVVAISKEKKDAKTIRAKGGAKDILYFNNLIFRLDIRDKVLNFFQLLRDEAHRSAISFHQKTKLKDDKKISLMSVDGVGSGYIKKIVLYFGSFSNIKKANLNELENVVPKNIAKKIYDFLHM
jgi:excinuclease ABC subunit C